MMRTASIKLEVTPAQSEALGALRSAYAEACNLLVPVVQEHRVWNRVALHQLAYTSLRELSPLGSQMCCNAIYSVCQAYRSQKERGCISPETAIPLIHFKDGSVHYDKRTYTLKPDGTLSLYTLTGRITVAMRPGRHQRRILQGGIPREAELIRRNRKWFFNLVVESIDTPARASGPVLGVDIGELNLAATSTGRLFGGEALRHRRDQHQALRRRLQSNGSQSARQKLRQVSGKEARRVRNLNHEVSKAIIGEAQRIGASRIVLEDLTHIRERIRAGKHVRSRLHRWPFRQLQDFVEYKASALGIEVVYVNPAYTSQDCAACGERGQRRRHRFECAHCGLRAHSDLNASRNLARIGETAVSPRAAVNTPDVGCLPRQVSP